MAIKETITGIKLLPKWRTICLPALLFNDSFSKILAHEFFGGLHKKTLTLATRHP